MLVVLVVVVVVVVAFELSLREFVGQGLPAVDEVGEKGASK